MPVSLTGGERIVQSQQGIQVPLPLRWWRSALLLIRLGHGLRALRPRHGGVKRHEPDQVAGDDVVDPFRLTGTVGHPERIGQVAHHLVRGHLAPLPLGMRRQGGDPLTYSRSGSRVGEGAHGHNSSVKAKLLAILLCANAFAQTPFVEQIRALGERRDFAATDRLIEAARKQAPNSPELALAISWQGRAALAAKNYTLAERYAGQARTLCLQILKTQKLDSSNFLPLALGASIEVEAQTMAARGEVSGAVAFLQGERRKYAGTSIVERITKNINLLSLEGKPAPSLDATEWIGTKPPSLASMKGKPVVLFFWAHWCSDCKAQAPILARLMQRYGPRGLQMMAPTRYYGYVEGGEEAKPAQEKPYIAKIRDQYYGPLKSAPVPLSNTIFEAYGCSSTPTIALVDKQGIVRWYHPGNATEAELAQRIEVLLK